MPRSFLVKKQRCERVKPGDPHEELNNDTPTHQCPGPWLQQRAQSPCSSSCPSALGVHRLHPPSSPSSPTTPPVSFLGPVAEAYKPAESCTEVNTEDHRRRQGFTPPSLPPPALFPILHPISGQHCLCLGCRKGCLSFSSLTKCEWSGKKYFSCKYCEKEYVSLGALKMHIRTHTLPCVCELCGKAFSRPWLLQGHIRTHTGEKPFSCFHCSRAFADRSNLRAHLHTHSAVKRYQCASCLKTFSRISLLAKHQEAGCLLT